MPEQKIGVCSICGGDVVGWVGGWLATVPPPPATCQSCNAVSAAGEPVIPMRKRAPFARKMRSASAMDAVRDWFARHSWGKD